MTQHTSGCQTGIDSTCSLALYSAREAAKQASGSCAPKGLKSSRAISSCSAARRTMDDLSSSRPARIAVSTPATIQSKTHLIKDVIT